MKKINFAILGAGKIAARMARTVQQMESVACHAVASRDAGRAAGLAERYGFKKAYGSYVDMLADPEVDLVYIATPIACHAPQMRMCLEAGKHVLCEKSFTMNAAEAGTVLALARAKGLLAAEAIWPRYMPMARTIREFCDSGRIGRIRSLTANIGFPVSHIDHIADPALGGGALLDIGVYALTFATMVMGHDIRDVSVAAVRNELGADLQSSIALTYGDGSMASLFNSALSYSDLQGSICGDIGYAVIDNINNFESLRLFDDDNRQLERTDRPPQITGFEYEVQSAVDAIRAGRSECPEMPHDEIMFMMTLMDRIRHGFGLWYPGEARP